MSKAYDRPIIIQRIADATETWEDAYKVHAAINKGKTDGEYLNAGAVQMNRQLRFEMRYFAGLEDISLNLQRYRIVYQGEPYNIVDYDDYQLKHRTVKLLGVSY